MIAEVSLRLDAYPREYKRRVLESFFEAMTAINCAYLLTHPDTPTLYKAGICYRREGEGEIWKDIPSILRVGFDDCEGLSSWLAAELRVRHGLRTAAVRLEPQKRRKNRRLWHAVVRDAATGQRWDPSAELGMRTRDGRKKKCTVTTGEAAQ